LYGNIDIVARSHVHYYARSDYDDKTGFTTPALKLRDDFAEQGGLGMAPRLGMVYVDVKSNGDYEVEPVLFKVPKKYYAERIKVDV
jgi:hypothetical protein